MPERAIWEPAAATWLLAFSPSHMDSCSWSLAQAGDIMSLRCPSCTDSMLKNYMGGAGCRSVSPAAVPAAGKSPPVSALLGPLARTSGVLSPPLHPWHRDFQPLRPVTL